MTRVLPVTWQELSSRRQQHSEEKLALENERQELLQQKHALKQRVTALQLRIDQQCQQRDAAMQVVYVPDQSSVLCVSISVSYDHFF